MDMNDLDIDLVSALTIDLDSTYYLLSLRPRVLGIFGSSASTTGPTSGLRPNGRYSRPARIDKEESLGSLLRAKGHFPAFAFLT